MALLSHDPNKILC